MLAVGFRFETLVVDYVAVYPQLPPYLVAGSLGNLRCGSSVCFPHIHQCTLFFGQRILPACVSDNFSRILACLRRFQGYAAALGRDSRNPS